MRVDIAPWPLVVITLSGNPRAEDLPIMFYAFEDDIFPRYSKYAVIADTRAVMRLPDASWRATLTAWLNKTKVRDHSTHFNVCTATLFSLAVVRGAYTALNWIWKPPTPTCAAVNMREAVAWCRKQLDAAHVPLTPGFLDFCRKNDALK